MSENSATIDCCCDKNLGLIFAKLDSEKREAKIRLYGVLWYLMEFKNYDGNHHRLQVDSDGSAESFMDTFRAFLYVCGFHPETIDDLLNEENQDERISTD